MKYVYVVIGGSTNIFVEQAWVSMWSLKYYNPNATVCIVTDEETKAYMNGIKELISLVDEFYPNHFKTNVSPIIRSRWLKTKLREILQGDFVYIDSDTIVTGDLSSLTEGYDNIGMVIDMHMPFEKHIYKNIVINLFRRIYKEFPPKETNYYNGGFLCCKETKITHDFFNRWHNNWLECCKQGINIDQISLLRTTIEMPQVVIPMSGIYNCQLSYSIQYLYEAKIMHFQRMEKRIGDSISPFYEDNIYNEIKSDCRITENVQKIILRCKSCISSPSITLTEKEFRLFHSKFFSLFKLLYR